VESVVVVVVVVDRGDVGAVPNGRVAV
jgi:hypothetical protein